MYCIASKNNNKTFIHRITFSKSLAKYIIEKEKQNYFLLEKNFILGKKLTDNESSKNGLYALMDKNKNIVLRISMNKEISKIHLDNNYRYLNEIYLN